MYDVEAYRLRYTRNLMLKTCLTAGKSVQYRSLGWSLWPKVCWGDCCLFEPVFDPETLKVGDIVFCEVTMGFNAGDRFQAREIERIVGISSPETFLGERVKYFILASAVIAPPFDSDTDTDSSSSACRPLPGSPSGECREHQVYGRLVEVIQ